jgi:hypothetical protein
VDLPAAILPHKKINFAEVFMPSNELVEDARNAFMKAETVSKEFVPSKGFTPALRFKLGSIKGSKKSGFGPYVTPPKRLRIFDFLVRDQEVGGSNPLAPTIYLS